MWSKLKEMGRDLIPKRYQVPVKYWYCWVCGTLEDEMKLLEFLVRRHDLVVDVGGNRGMYTYQFWKLGARVEVFEPNPACARVLSAWALGKSGVNVHSVALSSHAGSANLHIPIDESGIEHDSSASIENTGFAHSHDELVPLQTLDSFGLEDVSLIKIDVEGHEYRVIEGAGATLAASRPALLVEIEQRHTSRPIAEVFEKIKGYGYQGYFISMNAMTALEKFDVARHQSMEHFGTGKGEYINNFLFLHRDRLANVEPAPLVNGESLK
jgi:FkbM family methyltransferase